MPSPGKSALAAVVITVFASAQTPAPGAAGESKPASVEGEVRNAATRAPVERAHVVLHRFVDGRSDLYGAMTNPGGHFLIGNLPPGAYTVTLERTGYVDLNPQDSNQIALGSGEKKTALKLTLTPTGSIIGRVLDADGIPVEGMMVKSDSGTGGWVIRTTDDRGVFRIGGLAPGKYRVMAQPQSVPLPPEIRTDGTAEVHYSPTYYPSALSARDSSRVEVRAGVETTGVDIRLQRTPIVRVSGRVVGAPPGESNISVSMLDGNAGARPRPDGAFEFWRVDPGRRTLVAYCQTNGVQLYSAGVEVEVGSNDVDNVELRLVAPFNIGGKVEFDDEDARHFPPLSSRPTPQQGQQPPKPPPRILELHDPRGNVGGTAELNGDTFQLERLRPGLYNLGLTGPVYVRSIQYGEANIEGSRLDLRSGAAAPVTLHVASATGSLSGTVRDDKGPVAEAWVVVAEVTHERPLSHQVRSRADGSFNVPDLPPGKYRVAAMEERDNGLPRDSREVFDDWGEAFDLSDHEALTKDLKIRERSR
jgi:hypothetical protein